MSGYVPPHLYMLSWHVQGNLPLCDLFCVFYSCSVCSVLGFRKLLVLVWIRGKRFVSAGGLRCGRRGNVVW